jgi:outer membrane protein assembly factor BamB
VLPQALENTMPYRVHHVVIVAALLVSSGAVAHAQQQPTADWPQLLGPTRNGVYYGGDIPTTWTASGPRIVWKKPVGEGFAGPVVVGNRLILFHRRANQEIVECLDIATGDPQWSFPYRTSYRDDFGFDEGPRAAPTIANDRVYTFGAEGMLHCLDLKKGTKLWSVDSYKTFGVRKGFFGAACSPLVDDGKVLVNVGGAGGAGIVAFDAHSGDVLWKATDDEASYSSPTAATIAGRRHALFFTRTGLVDLDSASGEVLHQMRWRARINASVNAATPLVVGDRVFLSASYQTGAVLLNLGGDRLEPLWSSDDALSNHYATSVYHDGHLYGFHGRQEFGPSLRCIELATGKVNWSEDRFGAGTVTLAGDELVVLNEDGTLLLAPATPTGFKPTARAVILPATIRAYPALAAGRLYARNQDTLIALDLRKR